MFQVLRGKRRTEKCPHSPSSSLLGFWLCLPVLENIKLKLQVFLHDINFRKEGKRGVNVDVRVKSKKTYTDCRGKCKVIKITLACRDKSLKDLNRIYLSV